MIGEVRVSLEFGADVGQPWGSLFEARDASGSLIAGAQFCSVYNTFFANDHYALQFFLRPETISQTATFERLPRSTADAGVYLFDLGGQVYAKACAGNAHPKGWAVMDVALPRGADEKALQVWDPGTSTWNESDFMDGRLMRLGDGAMRIQDGVLKWSQSRIEYNGEILLDKPLGGFFHHVYYANEHLVFFHNHDEKITLHACRWNAHAQGRLDLGESVQLHLPRQREFPLAYGQWRNDVLVFTNLGGTYRLRNRQWQVLREPNGESYQIYSALPFKNQLLLAHYPSGHLYSYRGESIDEIAGWPPRLQNVSSQVREAQSCILHGGDLYVGVWPWAELWRLDTEAMQWALVDRLFTHPDLTDEFPHPYEREIRQSNALHATNFVENGWGQRITSMAPLEDSLLIGTSAKWNWPAEVTAAFMKPAQREQYGQVLQMKTPGVVTGSVGWRPHRTELAFEVDESEMRILQDDKLIARRAITSDLARRFQGSTLSWGDGIAGRFPGTLVPTVVRN